MKGRYSTVKAVLFVLLGVIALVVGYFGLPDEGQSTRDYWLGVVITTVLFALVLGRTYYINKRGLTPHERKGVLRTAPYVALSTVLGTVGCLAFLYFRREYGWFTGSIPSALPGSFGAALFIFGAAILLDNLWLKTIFYWNSSDPVIRKQWGGK